MEWESQRKKMRSSENPCDLHTFRVTHTDRRVALPQIRFERISIRCDGARPWRRYCNLVPIAVAQLSRLDAVDVRLSSQQGEISPIN